MASRFSILHLVGLVFVFGSYFARILIVADSPRGLLSDASRDICLLLIVLLLPASK